MTGVGDLLARPRFELIPIAGADEHAGFLPPGSIVTVTCSPRKGIEATLDLAERLGDRGFRVVPHVSARLVRSPAHLGELASRLASSRIADVFVIGGDSREPHGPYGSALDLLAAWAERGDPLPTIGVGAYPERHPLIEGPILFEALRAKQRFADYAVTQICFDAGRLLAWLARMRRRGITLPVHVGLPGSLRRRKLLEISLRVGVGDSVRYLTKHGGIVNRLVRRGTYRPDALIAGIAASLQHPASEPDLGIRGFHINTFNQVELVERWRQHALAVYGHEGEDEHERGSAS